MVWFGRPDQFHADLTQEQFDQIIDDDLDLLDEYRVEVPILNNRLQAARYEYSEAWKMMSDMCDRFPFSVNHCQGGADPVW